MKKIQLFAAIGMIAFTTNSFGQQSAVSIEGSSAATIITPLTITASNDGLLFGTITEYGVGTITVNPGATATATAAGLVQAVGGVVSAASFTVKGHAEQPYSITIPENGVVSLEGNAEGALAMPVNDFLSNKTAGTIGTEDTFYVGATLEVADGQAAGLYEGTFDVTVQYN